MNGYRFLAACLTILAFVSGCARPQASDPHADIGAADEIRTAMLAGGGAAGGSAAAASTGTGWATLKGKFVFAAGASIPAPTALRVDKDTATCGPGANLPAGQTLLIDPQSRGIANVAVFVRKTQRVHDDAKKMSGPVVFDQEKCIFSSHVFPVIVGTNVAVKNSDPIGHNTNIQAKKGVSSNETLPAGAEASFTPTAEEALPISVTCSIHPWMQAYMLPRASGYYAVTAPDGSFEIANLPDGEDLEFQVWHERASGAGGAMAEGEADGVKWSSKGRFKIKLKDKESRDLQVTVPASAFK